MRPEVFEAMLPYFTRFGYNASSTHAEGRAARAALDDARARVASLLGARPKEIVFTSSGSEGATLAIAGGAKAGSSRGRHLVSLRTEHHAVLHTLEALRGEGFEVSLLEVDGNGRIDPEQFRASLTARTILASVAYANNELGTIAPIPSLAGSARERGVLFHTDAVQAPLSLPLNCRTLGVDLLSLAAHKFYGPKGTGALFVREGTALQPTTYGGSQEDSKRAGTENIAGIVGLATALELASAERESTARRMAALRDELEAGFLRIRSTSVNGAGAPRLPNISSVSFVGVTSEALLMRLDLEGIAVSAGSACASGAIEPSHVIAALGLDEARRTSVVRFSLGRTTTQSEIARTVSIVERVVPELRSGFEAAATGNSSS